MEKKRYYVVAVSHIDLGFVKRKEELAELVEILLERVISVLERYPELHFAIEQAYHYRGLEKRRPDLLEKVKKLIAQGRIEMMGAMASSMDTNFTNGESFVRNQSLGIRWTKEHLDTRPEAAWLVDTFGINAQIPQILRQFGFRYLFANRFGGKNPYDIFCDCGLDGSEIVVLGRDLACQQIIPNSQAFVFCRDWNDVDRLFKDADGLHGELPRLVVYYLENEEVLSTYYRELVSRRNLRDGEEWLHASYGEYLRAIEGRTSELVKINGDLNPEFTGTFALRTPIKVWNRLAETALLEAEQWAALLQCDASEDLEKLWWDLSYVHFHDVLSGSHEDCTYLDVLDILKNVRDSANDILRSSFGEKGDKAARLYINGLPLQREEWLEVLNESGHMIHAYQDGEEIPVVYSDGKTFCRPVLPPVSVTEITVSEEPGPVPEGNAWQECRRCVVENEFLSLALDETKGIECLALRDGTVIMRDVRDFLVVQHDMGQFQIEMVLGEELSVMEETAHLARKQDAMGQRAVLSGVLRSMPWNGGRNELKWEIEFAVPEGQPAVNIKVTIDWKGEATRVRLKLPNTVNSSRGMYEIPFGIVGRSSYDGRPTAKGEWPTHRFVAVEDGEKGFALINRGVAGVEMVGSTLETTLLRAYPDTPDAWVPVTELSSQHGRHDYDFQIAAYGSEKADVVGLAQKFNRPVVILDAERADAETRGSFLRISASNLVLSSVKQADDRTGDLIVRYYETKGVETDAVIYIKHAEAVYLSDLTERKIRSLPCENQSVRICCRPYEIQTLRIIR